VVTGLPLITGATGFAGGHLVEHLTATGTPVLAWGHRHGRSPALPNVHWTAVELLDRSAVRAALAAAQPSAIYHCAGVADVHGAWSAPARALQINVIGTHNLLESASALGLRCRVLVTGSALVYRTSALQMAEDHPLGPASPYGVSKLAQEMAADASPLDTLLARPFNHAGPGQLPAYATSAFAQQVAEIEAGRRDAGLPVGNLDAKRDITDVRDTVRAYHALVDRGRPHRPYNVCSGRAYTMKGLLEILLSLARVRVRIDVDRARLRPSDNPVIHGSHARLTADTGWVPRIPIEQTLSDLLDYWRARSAS